jgi:nicotinate-nucleotide adenylyltransferase
MRIALYGGTFDPPHHGHLILAREAREQLALDRIVFLPAARSPFKPGIEITPSEVRVAMMHVAIDGEDGFVLDDSEVTRGGTSYTIDTVKAARERWPEAELFWFVGADHVPELPKWRDWETLRTLVQFIVFSRTPAVSGDAPEHPFPVVSRRFDVSATDIRARVAQGRSIRYLVPEQVRVLIEKHGLYRNPT